jgi:hypothetical protein
MAPPEKTLLESNWNYMKVIWILQLDFFKEKRNILRVGLMKYVQRNKYCNNKCRASHFENSVQALGLL